MFRAGKWAVAVALVGASVWAGFALTAQEPKPAAAADPKPVDLSALREAVATAAKRGENVDEVRKALDALEKALPTLKRGGVPAELQALRDAVDDAAKKGENVDAIAKELVVVETVVAGRSLAKPKPEPQPELPPNRFTPGNPGLVPFPVVPFPNAGGGIDVQAFQKAMDLRMKAIEMMAKNPRDPEARKLLAEATDLMMKAAGNAGGGAAMPAFPVAPMFPAFPDARFPDARIPDRARLGIRLEKLAPVTVEQLGLEPNVGIAVVGVVPGSAAEQAGLKVHDIILEFAGKPVSDNTEDFIRLVNTAKAGEKIDLVVLRKGKKVDVKGVVLPEAARLPRPAFELPNVQPVPFPNRVPMVPFPVLPNVAPNQGLDPMVPKPVVPNLGPNPNPNPMVPAPVPLPLLPPGPVKAPEID